MTPPPAGSVAGPLRSPCIRVCTLDHKDVCIGCGRTLDEIVRWASMSAAERQAVLARISSAGWPPAADPAP